MAQPQWEVPQTEEGMALVIDRLHKVREEGNHAELGNGLLALSHLVKWVRSDNALEPFARSHELAMEALEAFRIAHDPKGQVRALVAATAMADRSARDAFLAEAEQIARDSGDENLVGIVLAGKARATALSDRALATDLHKRAAEIFRRTGNRSGLANCLFGLSIGVDASSAKLDYATEAAALSRDLGDFAQAARCISIALMNAEELKPMAELEDLAQQGLQDAQTAGKPDLEGIFYDKLAMVAAAKGDVEGAARYRRWATELDDSDGMTPLERWQSDVEMTKLMVSMAKQQGHPEAAKMFAEELKRLKSEKPK